MIDFPQSLCAPLSDEHACGQDPKHLEAFLELRREATRGEGLSGISPDWNQVACTATTLLESTSKDLRIAVYLGLAWMQTQGLQGLARGLALIYALLSEYPQDLHPQARQGRLVGRTRCLEWFCEQATAWFKTQDSTNWSQACIDQSKQALEKLSTLDNRAIPNSAVVLAPLKRTLCKDVPRKVVPLPPGTPTTRTAQPQTRAPQSSWTWPQDPQLQAEALQACKERQKRIAMNLREQEPTNPLAYRWLRQALWNQADAFELSDIKSLPVSLLNEKSRKSLEEHLQHQRWPGLLESSEEHFLRHPFCLDLQRYSVLALEAMGNAHLAVQSIQAQIKTLLHTLPELPGATNTQGLPLATKETLAWIDEWSAPVVVKKASSFNPSQSQQVPRSESWWKTLQELPTKDTPRFLSGVQSALSSAPDRMSYARRCLQIAESHSGIPGLNLALCTLARSTLLAPNCEVLERSLESQALKTLLAHQTRPDSNKIPALRCQQTARLALELAKRDLSAAISYYR